MPPLPTSGESVPRSTATVVNSFFFRLFVWSILGERKSGFGGPATGTQAYFIVLLLRCARVVPHHRTISKTRDMATRKDPITENVIDPLWQFAKQSKMLINVCTKPDRKEFAKIATATSVGFLIMGFIGFFVKLVHIPINQIIVGGN